MHDLCLRRLLVVLAQHRVLLLLLAVQPPLARRLVLRTLGVHVVADRLLTGLLGLGLVDLQQYHVSDFDSWWKS